MGSHHRSSSTDLANQDRIDCNNQEFRGRTPDLPRHSPTPEGSGQGRPPPPPPPPATDPSVAHRPPFQPPAPTPAFHPGSQRHRHQREQEDHRRSRSPTLDSSTTSGSTSSRQQSSGSSRGSGFNSSMGQVGQHGMDRAAQQAFNLLNPPAPPFRTGGRRSGKKIPPKGHHTDKGKQRERSPPPPPPPSTGMEDTVLLPQSYTVDPNIENRMHAIETSLHGFGSRFDELASVLNDAVTSLGSVNDALRDLGSRTRYLESCRNADIAMTHNTPPHLRRPSLTADDTTATLPTVMATPRPTRERRWETRFLSGGQAESENEAEDNPSKKDEAAKKRRQSVPLGHINESENPVAETSIDNMLNDPSQLDFRSRYMLVPKPDEIPSFDSDGEKLLTYLDNMDTFLRTSQAPGGWLLSKWHSRLTGAALQWFKVRAKEAHLPQTWLEWKDELMARFLTQAVKRKLGEKYRTMQFRGQNPAKWLDEFVLAARAVQPGITNREIHSAVQLRVPENMAFNIESFLQAKDPQAGFARPAPSAPLIAGRTLQRLPTPPSTTRRCFRCNAVGHLASSCPQDAPPTSLVRPAMNGIRAIQEDAEEPEASEQAEAAEDRVESEYDEEDDPFAPLVLALSSSPAPAYCSDESSFTLYDSTGDWDDDWYPVNDSTAVLALDSVDAPTSPLLVSSLDATSPSATDLATAGAPVTLSLPEARASLKRAMTADAPLRTKSVHAGFAHTTASSLATRVFVNDKAYTIFLDTGAGPTVADEDVLDHLEPGWRSRLIAIQPAMQRCLVAFGGTLAPMGVLPLALIFPHPAGNLRLRVEFLVIPAGTCPASLVLGMDWMLAYGFNIMLEHGPYFSIGRNKQCFAISSSRLARFGSDMLTEVSQSLNATCNPPAIRSIEPIIAGRPTPEPEAFEKALLQMHINPKLSPSQRDSLISLIRRFPMVFAHGSHQLGNLRDDPGCFINLDLDNLPPRIRQSAYPASPRALAAMRKCVDDQIAMGIVRPSNSEFSSPALVVFRGKKARLVVNYKVLSSITKHNAYPMPRIDQTLYSLKDSKFFTSLDANKGFHQIPMAPEHVNRTAFATPFGQFEYLRMPMGLKNAPAEFQRRMDSHFHVELREGWFSVYIDDLLLRSLLFAKHMTHLERTFIKLEYHAWTMSPLKCFFAYAEVNQLGHRVSGILLQIDDNKVAAVKFWAYPTKLKELQEWLGFSGYFRKFIKDYGSIARPLTRLLGKDVKFEFNAGCIAAFEALRHALLNAPVLGQPDYKKPFEVSTDASFLGLGGCLEQVQTFETGTRKVAICFISRQLKASEERYSMPQLECLAVVWALNKLHIFIDGLPFTVWTDAGSLKTLMDMAAPSRPMLGWQLAIQEYRGFAVIKHRMGKANGAADGLSRNPLPNDETNPAADLGTEPEPRVQALSFALLDDEFFEKVRRSYNSSRDFSRIRSALAEPEKDSSALLASVDAAVKKNFNDGRFILLDGLLYRREGSAVALVVLDVETRASLLASCHDEVTSGHFGFDKTYARVKPLAWWPGVHADTETYCSSCAACQRANHPTGKPYGLAVTIAEPKEPGELVNMDFIGPFAKVGRDGFDCVLVIADRFSRKVRFIPTYTDADARFTAWLFYSFWMNDSGVPRGIISDRDKLFTSNFWKALASLCGYKLQLSTAYHPQTDGLAERYVRTLEDCLRRFCAFEPTWTDESGFSHSWNELLPGLEFAFNTAKHATLRQSPFKVERGRNPRSIYSLIKDGLPRVTLDSASSSFSHMLLATQERAKACLEDAVAYAQKRWDERHQEPPFEVGDDVSTKNFRFGGEQKLTPPFVGPFAVTELVGPNAVRVALTPPYDRKHPVFPVSLLKRFIHGDPARFPGRRDKPPPPPDIVDGEAYWVVDRILDQRRMKPPKGKRGSSWQEFLVHWEGRGPEYDRWVKEVDLAGAKEALRDWRRQHRADPSADASLSALSLRSLAAHSACRSVARFPCPGMTSLTGHSLIEHPDGTNGFDTFRVKPSRPLLYLTTHTFHADASYVLYHGGSDDPSNFTPIYQLSLERFPSTASSRNVVSWLIDHLPSEILEAIKRIDIFVNKPDLVVASGGRLFLGTSRGRELFSARADVSPEVHQFDPNGPPFLHSSWENTLARIAA
ncbi:hypothetical protein JCM10207_008535 [Rhodosporidiobolus poonsookiae]